MMPPSRAAIAALLAACGPAMAYAACLGGLTLFRLYYYGALLPNTAYAKIGTIPIRFGFIYTGTFLTDGPGLVVPLALLGGWRLRRYRAPLLFCAATMIYVIAIGGDFFASGRFLLAPFAVLLAGATAAAGPYHRNASPARRDPYARSVGILVIDGDLAIQTRRVGRLAKNHRLAREIRELFKGGADLETGNRRSCMVTASRKIFSQKLNWRALQR